MLRSLLLTRPRLIATRLFHQSAPNKSLHQFFESTKLPFPNPALLQNIGRPWDLGALRAKNWPDLHTLWFTLLRERNRLISEKVEANRMNTDPNPVIFRRYQKVRLSMARIKSVIHERYTAWLEAQRLWDLKLKGVDIYDPEVIKQIEEQDRIEKHNQKVQKFGKYMPHRVLKRRQPLFVAMDENDAVKELNRKLELFRIEPKKASQYDLDMIPKANRGHRSRRRIGKFLLSGRKQKIPIP